MDSGNKQLNLSLFPDVGFCIPYFKAIITTNTFKAIVNVPKELKETIFKHHESTNTEFQYKTDMINIPNLMKIMKPPSQETPQTLGRINTKGDFIVKLIKAKNKQKILKARKRKYTSTSTGEHQ